MLQRLILILMLLLALVPLPTSADSPTLPPSLDYLVNNWWCSSPNGTPTYAHLRQTVDYLQDPTGNQTSPFGGAVHTMPTPVLGSLYNDQFGLAGQDVMLIDLGAALQAADDLLLGSFNALTAGNTADARLFFDQAQAVINQANGNVNTTDTQLLNALLQLGVPITPDQPDPDAPPPTTPTHTPTRPANTTGGDGQLNLSSLQRQIQAAETALSIINSSYNCGYAPIVPSNVAQVNKVDAFQIGYQPGVSYLPTVKTYPGASTYALVGGNHDDKTVRLVYLPTQTVTELFTDSDFINVISYSSALNPQSAALAGGSSTLWYIRNLGEVIYGENPALWTNGNRNGNSKLSPRQLAPVIEQWTGHTNSILDTAFSPDGHYLASASVDNTARLWDTATGQTVHILQHETLVLSVAFSSDGELVATGSGTQQGVVRIWSVASGAEVDTIPLQSSVNGLVATPDGGFAFGAGTNTLVWRPDSEMQTFVGGIVLGFSPDGLRLLTEDFTTTTLYLWDYATAGQVSAFDQHAELVYPFLVNFSADGQLVFSGDRDDNLRIWAADTGVELGHQVITTGLRAFDLAHDERSLLVGGWDGSLSVYAVGAALPEAQVATPAPPPTTDTTPAAPLTCVLQARDGVNLRTGPGTGFARGGGLDAGQRATADGQAVGADGLLWYRVQGTLWVRSDVVTVTGDCANLTVVP